MCQFASAVAALHRPLTWLLTAGMVGMAAVGALLAWLLLDVDPALAWLIGAVLAPTDPVLSSSIVSGRPAEQAVPERLRGLLSAESGANDGLAFPLVVLGVTLVRDEPMRAFAVEGGLGFLVAVAVGFLIGVLAGRVLRSLERAHEIEHSAYFVYALVLALFSLAAVNGLGGDGVLGVFVAGLAYNRTVGEAVFAEERQVEEGINRVLVLPAFVLLGVVLPWDLWTERAGELALFTVGVLLIRRLPVIAALRRPLHLDGAGTAFYGWFGPIGVAALFLATFAHEQGVDDPIVWSATTAVVAASTVVHGVTAAPGRALMGRVGGGPP